MKKLEKYLKESDEYKVLSGKLEKRVEKTADSIMKSIDDTIINDYPEVEAEEIHPMIHHKIREQIKQTIVQWIALNGDISKMD